MSGSRLSPQLLLALVALALQWPEETTADPETSLSSLFANALLRAQRMQKIATDLVLEYKSTYLKDKPLSNENSRSCNSEALHAPTGKGDVLKKTDTELLIFSLALIQSWLGSAQGFVNVFDSLHKFPEKLKDVEQGIQNLIRELKNENSQGLQPITNISSYDRFESDNQNETSKLKNYGLLSCFKRDLSMVATYARAMKIRRFG